MLETIAVLVFPLAGALLLAAIGQRTWASRVNVAVSFLTWLASIAAADTDNADGIAGVDYASAQIMPVQVLAADGTVLRLEPAN